MNNLSSEFLEGLTHFGLTLDDHQAASLVKYRDQIIIWNKKFNLTAIKSEFDIEIKLFLDSLSIANYIDRNRPVKVLDLGSGAGIPGLPLKILFPHIEMHLLESQKKKVSFIEHIISTLELNKSTYATNERSETLAHHISHREKYDYIVCRAVAKLPVLIELSLPFLKTGGHLLAQKNGDITTEIAESEKALNTIGGYVKNIHNIKSSFLPNGRKIVDIEKQTDSPIIFPRRPGIPNKTPLK